ncbi:MAG: hypothetical protein WD876_00350 [Candidatus Pacearchaeota archaeon]
MVEVLERIAEKSGSASMSKGNRYLGSREYSSEGAPKDTGYSTFAEMYLEKPVEVQAGFSVTICTWRGIPTVDDW